jgi:molybdate/tungstate transport system substrate-binding protein
VTDDTPGATRRRFLAAAGTTVAAGVAGCSARPGGGGADRGARPSRTPPGTSGRGGGRSTAVSVLAAGSLQHSLETGLQRAVDVPVEVEAHGSATVARLIHEGQRDPDVVVVADTALFERPLSPPWYSIFAGNAVVLAYNPDTEGGRRIETADDDRWYEPLVDGDVRLGRTDPDQDPLGYRALFTLELASRYYEDAPDLREAVPRREQVYPETALVSQFEIGSVDAALAYRNMAVERDYAFVDLPDQIDLSDPTYADEWYSTVSYTLPGGQVVRGGPVGYASTIRRTSDAAVAVFDALTTGGYLAESGFLLREEFPTYVGDVPERVSARVGHSARNRSGDGSSVRPPSGTVSDLAPLR